jgi:hypothetical protein
MILSYQQAIGVRVPYPGSIILQVESLHGMVKKSGYASKETLHKFCIHSLID